jgi:hypothetical protein
VQRLQDFRTRYSFGDSIWAAADWIAGRFRDYGYTEVRLDTFMVRDPTLGANVVAVKPGLTHPGRQIVIGGHYDSVVNIGHPMQWAPGADDNASGTALALEIARILRDVPLENTLVFIAFAAEEQGLDGSWHYAAEAAARGDDIVLMLNADMIAHVADADPDVSIYTNGASQAYADLMAQMAAAYTGLTPVLLGASGNSDHWPFMQYGYHAVMGHEGDFSGCWHRPCDTWDAIGFSAGYAADVVRMVAATALSVSVPLEATGVALTPDDGDDSARRDRLMVTPAPGRGPFRFHYTEALPPGPGVSGAWAGEARLVIHDARGRRVHRSGVLAAAPRAAGVPLEIEAAWNGADETGRTVAPGVYFARLEFGAREAAATRVIVTR